jgi:hypothetical protein
MSIRVALPYYSPVFFNPLPRLAPSIAQSLYTTHSSPFGFAPNTIFVGLAAGENADDSQFKARNLDLLF